MHEGDVCAQSQLLMSDAATRGQEMAPRAGTTWTQSFQAR